MEWSLFRSRLKRAWVWTKHHWYIPFVIMGLIIGFLLYVITRNSMYVGLVTDVLDNARKSHQEEIDKLNEIEHHASRERARILSEYNKNIDKLEKEYTEKDQELDEKKKKEIKKLVEEGYNDPDVLSREIARLYGFEHG
jgi:F0F1-type ATP synthase membrane subunit b/b'